MTTKKTSGEKCFGLRRAYAKHDDDLRKKQGDLIDAARVEVNSIQHFLKGYRKDSRDAPVDASVLKMLSDWASVASVKFQDAEFATLAADARRKASDDEVKSAASRLAKGKGECFTVKQDLMEDDKWHSPFVITMKSDNGMFGLSPKKKRPLALGVDLRASLFIASVCFQSYAQPLGNTAASRLLNDAYGLSAITDRDYYLSRARRARDEVAGMPVSDYGEHKSKGVILKALDDFIRVLKDE